MQNSSHEQHWTNRMDFQPESSEPSYPDMGFEGDAVIRGWGSGTPLSWDLSNVCPSLYPPISQQGLRRPSYGRQSLGSNNSKNTGFSHNDATGQLVQDDPVDLLPSAQFNEIHLPFRNIGTGHQGGFNSSLNTGRDTAESLGDTGVAIDVQGSWIRSPSSINYAQWQQPASNLTSCDLSSTLNGDLFGNASCRNQDLSVDQDVPGLPITTLNSGIDSSADHARPNHVPNAISVRGNCWNDGTEIVSPVEGIWSEPSMMHGVFTGNQSFHQDSCDPLSIKYTLTNQIAAIDTQTPTASGSTIGNMTANGTLSVNRQVAAIPSMASIPTAASTSFPCTYLTCNKYFKRDSDRLRHENTHRNVRGLYLCPIPGCPKSRGAGYSRADKVTEHLWKKHANLGYTKA